MVGALINQSEKAGLMRKGRKQKKEGKPFFGFALMQAEAEIARLRESIRALIEVYAPYERKSALLREHLDETQG